MTPTFFPTPAQFRRWLERELADGSLSDRERALLPAEPDRVRARLADEEWSTDEAIKPGSSTIEIELTPEGAGTRLHFVHRDLPSEAAAESHAVGWDHYLPRLAIAAGGGDPGEDPWLTQNMTSTS